MKGREGNQPVSACVLPCDFTDSTCTVGKKEATNSLGKEKEEATSCIIPNKPIGFSKTTNENLTERPIAACSLTAPVCGVNHVRERLEEAVQVLLVSCLGSRRFSGVSIAAAPPRPFSATALQVGYLYWRTSHSLFAFEAAASSSWVTGFALPEPRFPELGMCADLAPHPGQKRR